MSLSDDRWVASYSIIDPLKLHALGVVATAWNSCELNLIFIFSLLIEKLNRTGWIVAHDMGDVTLMNKITEIAKHREKEPEALACLLNMMKVYDACRMNRNSLTHFSLIDDGKEGFDILRLKGPNPVQQPMSSDLNDIRRVAAELWSLAHLMNAIIRFYRDRNTATPAPLPQIVAVPELLWKPPQQNQRAPRSQPLPSGA